MWKKLTVFIYCHSWQWKCGYLNCFICCHRWQWNIIDNLTVLYAIIDDSRNVVDNLTVLNAIIDDSGDIVENVTVFICFHRWQWRCG